MKLNKIIFSTCAAAAIASSMSSCKDDDMFTIDGQQAFIICTNKIDCPYVEYVDENGVKTKYKSRMSNDTIYIQLNPIVDPNVVLKDAVLKFCLSKGASVTPDPTTPQDFTVEGGVKYTVTSEDGKTSRTYVVTHGLTDNLPYGDGATLGNFQLEKIFTDLGYPGERANFNLSDSRLYGDINGYIAFCGHDHIVIMGRQYTDPKFDNPIDTKEDVILSKATEYGIRVYNASDFSYAGALNLGSIVPATASASEKIKAYQTIKAISSDWNGVMAATVVKASGSTDIYTWDNPTSEPKLLGSVAENLGSFADGANYIQISGDLKGTANIACGAPRSAEGNHFIVHLEGGQIVSTEKIATNYASTDCGGFQMISPMSAESNPDYIVGDNEGSGNNTIKVYHNTFGGRTNAIMPMVLQSTGSGGFHDWWVGTGSSLARTGARRPYVSCMPINGHNYVMLMNGTGWWWCNTLIDADDLNTRIEGAEYDFSVNASWSFGASGDWYWDESECAAYWIGWIDRQGAFKYKVTCFE